MPRYQVTFTEETKYVVEFESRLSLSELSEEGEVWFTVMDEFDPDWPLDAVTVDVKERDLVSLLEISAK